MQCLICFCVEPSQPREGYAVDPEYFGPGSDDKAHRLSHQDEEDGDADDAVDEDEIKTWNHATDDVSTQTAANSPKLRDIES